MTAKIWYWPNDADKAEEIEFPTPITMRHGPYSRYRISASEGMTGEINTTQYNGREVVRLEYRWTNLTSAGKNLRRKLTALCNHLERGGYCAFAENYTRAFAGFLVTLPTDASTTLRYRGNLFGNLYNAGSIASREIDILSDPDHHIKEMKLVSTHTILTKTITVSGTPIFDYSACNWAMIREHTCMPAVRIPLELRSEDKLYHDREVVNYLDLPLETDIAQLGILESTGLIHPGTTGGRPVLDSKEYEGGDLGDPSLSWWNR